MKTTYLKLPLVAILAFSLVFVACSEDDPTVAEQLEGTWMVSQVFVKNGTDPEVEITDSIPDCFGDNPTTFTAENTYQVTDGATKCDPADPDIVDSGTWSLIDGDTKLVNDSNEPDTENDTLAIVSISDSRAEFTQTLVDSTSTTVIRRIVTKQ